MNGSTTEIWVDLNPAGWTERLEVHLQGRLRGHVRDFRLVVGDRGLLLRGKTVTYYAKQLAQHAVMQATNLPIQANEIEVSRVGPPHVF